MMARGPLSLIARRWMPSPNAANPFLQIVVTIGGGVTLPPVLPPLIGGLIR